MLASINGLTIESLTPFNTNTHKQNNNEINLANRTQIINSTNEAPVSNVNLNESVKLPFHLDSHRLDAMIAKTRTKRVILFRPLFVYRQQQARKELLRRKFELRRLDQRIDNNKFYNDYRQTKYPDRQREHGSARKNPYDCKCD